MSSRLKRSTIELRGETFHYREWTPAEREAAFKQKESSMLLFTSYLCFACILKEDGTRLFKDQKEAANEPAELIDELAGAILKLSGVKSEEEDEEPKKH